MTPEQGRVGTVAPMSSQSVLERVRGLPPYVADAGIGVVLLLIGLVGLAGPVLIEQPYREMDALGYGLLALQTLPLAWRRLRPGGTLGVVGLSGTAYLVLEYLPTNAMLGPVVAIYSFAVHGERHRRWVFVAVLAVWAFVFLGGRWYAERVELTWEIIAVNLLVVFSTWLAGGYVRVRREQTEALEERTRRLEREQDEQARRAVAEERARIARELHDVVAHNVSVMVVQAGAARRAAETAGEDDTVGETLGTIETVGRQALTDMRRLLDVLRTDGKADETERGALEPQPSLRSLEDLVEQIRETGLSVDVEVDGDLTGLSAGVDLTGYRVVQEALTNALKHAGPAQVEVRIENGPQGLEIEVVDDGRGAGSALVGPSTRGLGLVGMEERVALFGGEMSAGPRVGGGYRVLAWLPRSVGGGQGGAKRRRRAAWVAARGGQAG